jgi:hypothetical protein
MLNAIFKKEFSSSCKLVITTSFWTCLKVWEINLKRQKILRELIKKRGLINVPPFSAIHTQVFHTWFSASTPGFSQPL